MPCDRVGGRERGVEARRPALGSREVGELLGAGRAGRLGDTVLVAEHQHLNVRRERDPAREGTPLDLADPAHERLRHREDGQHAAQPSPLRCRLHVGPTAENRHKIVTVACGRAWYFPSLTPSHPGRGTGLAAADGGGGQDFGV